MVCCGGRRTTCQQVDPPGHGARQAAEPETGIITACDPTSANIGYGPVGVKLLQGEEPGLDVLADSAYAAGEVRKDLHDAQHAAVIKPMQLPKNRRLGDDQFTRDDFMIEYQERTVTCPNNITVMLTVKGAAVFGVKYRGCPIRDRCTAAVNGKTLKVSEHDQYVAQARARWRQGIETEDYRQHRPMVERSIAWLVTNGNRRVKYRGVERNRIGLSIRAAAVNLRRIVNLGPG
jgi:hypothetical protein